MQVRRALCEAERQLEMRQQMPRADLQQWLQYTYEIETKYFEERRHLTEKQLVNAKDMVDDIALLHLALLLVVLAVGECPIALPRLAEVFGK